ncbi:MAG: hypothetical protein Q4F24_15425 [Eubacteriales bacterium]|nr:hypothetical protein [Eubacteriales bacterium]
MKMQHLLIEAYCDGKLGEGDYPCRDTLKLGIYCLRCPQFSYSECPNEIAISDNGGLVECQKDYIGFGGDMEPEDLEKRDDYIAIWKNICREKIGEAYEEYISQIALKRG